MTDCNYVVGSREKMLPVVMMILMTTTMMMTVDLLLLLLLHLLMRLQELVAICSHFVLMSTAERITSALSAVYSLHRC